MPLRMVDWGERREKRREERKEGGEKGRRREGREVEERGVERRNCLLRDMLGHIIVVFVLGKKDRLP